MTTHDPSAAAVSIPPSLEPGWYPDPIRDERTERWWSGQGWTGYTRPAAVPPTPLSATAARVRPQNRLAWASLVVGLLGLVLALILFFSTGWVGVSWVGVAAVVLGVRALLRRSTGASTAAVPAVVGIASGGLATLVMLATFLPLTSPTAGDGDSGAAVDGYAMPTDVPLDAIPRQTIPDDALSQYNTVTIRSVTASTAGCGVFSIDQESMPLDTQPRTAKRIEQDNLSLQLQQMTAPIRADAPTSKTWPKAMDIDPETGVVFLPAPACTRLGVRPKGAELRFGTSADRGQIALALWDPLNKVGSIWRSVDDTVYQL